MTQFQQQVINWIKSNPFNQIVIVRYRGVEAYNASQPVGTGVYAASEIEDLVNQGILKRTGDIIK